MSVFIEIYVVPGSGKQECVLDDAGNIKWYLKSPADRGKANQELIAALARLLKIPRHSIYIKSGMTTRRKLIKLPIDLSREEILRCIGIGNAG